MVYAFIVCEVKKYTMLFFSVFDYCGTPETSAASSDSSRPPNPSHSETIRNIIQQIKAQFDFNYSLSTPQTSGGGLAEMQDDVETNGLLNVSVHAVDKVALWHVYSGCMYILICDKTENRLLAARILVHLIRSILEHVIKNSDSVYDVVLKGDAMASVINTFLPHGQLLFLHNRALQQLNKELGKTLSK